MHMPLDRQPEVTLAIMTPCCQFGIQKNPAAIGLIICYFP